MSVMSHGASEHYEARRQHRRGLAVRAVWFAVGCPPAGDCRCLCRMGVRAHCQPRSHRVDVVEYLTMSDDDVIAIHERSL